jgi:glyoxylase-like metal-dependent hydrolase (beta-lactamase superfamily II)
MDMKVKFFQAGYCTHPEAVVIKGGRWKIAEFPSLFALISHPQFGHILYDTGYTERFFTETKKFPLQIYALTTPVYFQPEDSAVYQLQKLGIKPDDINYIIISHFHADHVGGLLDFPNAQFICFQSAYQAVKDLQGFKALQAGFLSGLIPSDFAERGIFAEEKLKVKLPAKYAPFTEGIDLFGDGSLLAIELPGHVIGQLGLLFTDSDNTDYFLIADACWLSRAYQEFVLPHPITNLISANNKDYADTLAKIHLLYQSNPQIKIVPTHCGNIFSS